MSRKVSLGAAVSAAALAAAVAVSLTYVYAMGKFNEKLADVNERQAMYTKLAEVDRSVRQEYDGEWSEAELRDSACMGYLAGLQDPNSEYFSAQEYKAILDSEAEPESGIGVRTIQGTDGNMEIVRVLAGSSGEEAGLRAGDVIFELNGENVVRIGYGTAVKSLKGRAGSSAALSVLRTDKEGVTKVLSFSVPRTDQGNDSIESRALAGELGYLSIRSFDNGTPQCLQDAYTVLRQQGIRGVILDLRDNSGEDMEAMALAVDRIVPAGVTVCCEKQDGTVETEKTSDAASWDLPVAVLINSGTEGAAEVFAADVRCLYGGILVGEKSMGNAPMVKTVMLSDGSAVRFTAAQYLTPDGETISGAGLVPDMQAALSEEEHAKLLRGTLEKEADVQLRAAVAALSAQGVDSGDFPVL